MESITLAVTTRVVQQAIAEGEHQRQIAIQGASPELLTKIHTARRNRHIHIAINGVFEMSVGDTAAIWNSHQTPGVQADDFASLYELLARRPDQAVTFSWTDEKVT